MTEPEKWRKKPITIEAVQLTRDNRADVAAWCGGHYETDALYRAAGMNPDGSMMIRTLEGWVKASVGDWIIRGVKGEFYPCKPDSFSATYEPDEVTE